MSDLHLEVGQQYADFAVPVEAPYLILAGDIGRLKDYQPYLEFLRRQCDVFSEVFLVLGNHEFFGTNYTEGIRLANCLEKEPCCAGKLHVLNRNRVDLSISSGITILGCTLWSKISPDVRSMVEMRVNDFKRIDNWTVDDHNFEHEQDVQWLRDEICKIRQERDQSKKSILVITHHAPTNRGTSKPSDLINPWSCAFSTDLLKDKALSNVQWWIFGHTHFTSDFKQGQVRLVSNQRGYILNGVAIGGQKSRTTKSNKFPQLATMKGRNHKEFDVGKVFKI